MRVLDTDYDTPKPENERVDKALIGLMASLKIDQYQLNDLMMALYQKKESPTGWEQWEEDIWGAIYNYLSNVK